MKKILLLLLCVAQYTAFSQTTSDSLKAYLPCNGNASDISSLHNNGILQGNIEPTVDRFGNFGCALKLNKTSVLQLPLLSDYRIARDSIFSISFWVNFDDASASDTFLRQRTTPLVSRHDSVPEMFGNVPSYGRYMHPTKWDFIELNCGVNSPECTVFVNNQIGPYLVKYPANASGDLFFGNFEGAIDDIRIFSIPYGQNPYTKMPHLTPSNTSGTCVVTSLEETQENASIGLAPNPSTGMVRISPSIEAAQLEILNSQGQLVYAVSDLSHLELHLPLLPGMYVARIYGKKGMHVEKLVIENK